MTEQNHPIIPPSYLLRLWREQHCGCNREFNELLIEAARWGADQELEACCEWIHNETYDDCATAFSGFIANLRAARRPKPPSLKEQALEDLDALQADLAN